MVDTAFESCMFAVGFNTDEKKMILGIVKGAQKYSENISNFYKRERHKKNRMFIGKG